MLLIKSAFVEMRDIAEETKDVLEVISLFLAIEMYPKFVNETLPEKYRFIIENFICDIIDRSGIDLAKEEDFKEVEDE